MLLLIFKPTAGNNIVASTASTRPKASEARWKGLIAFDLPLPSIGLIGLTTLQLFLNSLAGSTAILGLSLVKNANSLGSVFSNNMHTTVGHGDESEGM